LAVRQHNLHDTPDGLAILDGLQGNRNVVTRFEDLFAPTEVGHVRGIAGFRDPMDDRVFVVRRVELQPAMRICPNPLRDGRLQRELFVDIEIRIAVMRKKRGRGDQKS